MRRFLPSPSNIFKTIIPPFDEQSRQTLPALFFPCERFTACIFYIFMGLLNAKFLEIYYRLLHSKRQTTNHTRNATVKYRQQRREQPRETPCC
jgi:hypothetical protein